jgi:hypothetical protein
MSLLSNDELLRFGKPFLCELYRRAMGIAGRHFNKYRIFSAIGVNSFGGGERQITDEIVQFLRRNGYIESFKDSEDIALTDDRLDDTRRIYEGASPLTRLPP